MSTEVGPPRELVDRMAQKGLLGLAATAGAEALVPTLAVVDPATGVEIAQVGDATPEGGSEAVNAAAAALESWSQVSPRERSEILYRAYSQMIERHEDLARLISWENGKQLADAAAEVRYAAEFFRWFSEEAVRLDGHFGTSPAGDTRTIVTHRPVGVAALVTPWNFPAAMATRKVAPALAAGCTAVLKPAAETPLTALAIADILRQAGLPEGVLTVVPTTDAAGVVSAWLADPRVRKLSFTGSTAIGRQLLRQAADRVVNCSMELGGNAPFIVGRDADLSAAVAGAMTAKFRNGGQACTAANRFYVHQDVIEDFTQALGEQVTGLKAGSAFDDRADIGPVISKVALERVERVMEEAVGAGARVSHRGEVLSREGYFMAPAVLYGVEPNAELLSDEILGPVAPIVRWSDERELVEQVNASEYGLSAYVYSCDLKWALKVAESIEAGMVGINRGLVSDPAAPFGGVKQSGLGREGGGEGIREFLETQYFSVDWT